MKIFATWKFKNLASKKAFKSKRELNTFYGKETEEKFTKRFHFIHYVLKYKLIVPLMLIFKKIVGKRLVKKVGDEPQFEWVKRFDESFNEAAIKWNYIYINNLRKEKDRKTLEECKEEFMNTNRSSMFLVRLGKELFNTLSVNDDSYAEFLPFLMVENYFAVAKLVKDGKIEHLMRNVPSQMDPLHEMVYLTVKKQMVDGKMSFNVSSQGVQKDNFKEEK